MTIKADAAAKLLQFLNTEDWEIDYSTPATGLIIRHQSGTELTFKPDGTVDAPSARVDALEADDATISGNTALRDTSEAAATPGFGTWTQADADRPSLVITQLAVFTDGTTRGRISILVDKSGGTTTDYSLNSTIGPDAGSDTFIEETQVIYLPPGGQYKIVNSDDPIGSNTISDVREVIL